MRDSLETRLGIFVALALIAGVLVLEMGGGMEHFRRGVTIHALFKSAQELKVGDRVKMAGVDVGRVEGIQVTNRPAARVMVTMKLRPNSPVNNECVATVKFAGLMGQNFVSLDFGKPEGRPVEEGTFLATEEQADLSALMNKLDNVAASVEKLTDGFAGDEVQHLASSITGFFKDNRENLRISILNLSNITSQIASGQGTVGKMLYEDTLYASTLNTVSNLHFTADEVRLTVAEARKVVDEVNAGRGTAGRLVKDELLYNEATASMTNLKEILQKMNRGEGSVGKLINDDTLYKNAKMTLQKLDKATEGLEDQGPLSILGIAVNSLF
jgi:phospholipid/cholesterol/gamma-HCH transport system substrate-binding protein